MGIKSNVPKKGKCIQCEKDAQLLWWLGLPSCEECFKIDDIMPKEVRDHFISKATSERELENSTV
tara:strand:- start:1028 stop:1222 length:195 start_codon:yes stop_codon:yes gene_type:complete